MPVSLNGTSGLTFNDASTHTAYNDIFDYRDGKLFWKKTKRVDLVGKEAGHEDDNRYMSVKINNKMKKVHRVIFEMFHGYEPKLVDHINGNRKDNRIENLREVTHSQNSLNVSPINKDGTVKNVTWHKAVKKWNVRIMKNYKTVYSQYFEDLELAELVAQEARLKFHGNYARAV
jgi:hypothetical protein